MKTMWKRTMTRSAILAALALGALAAGEACGSSSSQTGCTKESDCSGGHVCVDGACIAVSGSSSSGSTTTSSGTGGSSGSSSSTSGSGGGSAVSSSSSSSSSGVACPGLLPGASCTIVPQCGCVAGQMCQPKDATGAGQCVIAGVNASGSPCSLNSDCAPGLGCALGFGDGNTPLNVCGAYYEYPDGGGPTPCNTAGARVDGQPGTAVVGFGACGVDCDLVNPASPTKPAYAKPCGSGATCATSYSGQIQADLCTSPAGTIPVGTSCSSSNTDANHGCAPGASCEFQGTVGTCDKYCHTVADCPTGKTCAAGSSAGVCL